MAPLSAAGEFGPSEVARILPGVTLEHNATDQKACPAGSHAKGSGSN
jgi:hypothetical protein